MTHLVSAISFRNEYFEMFGFNQDNTQSIQNHPPSNPTSDTQRAAVDSMQQTDRHGNNRIVTSGTTEDLGGYAVNAGNNDGPGSDSTARGSERTLSTPLLNSTVTNSESEHATQPEFSTDAFYAATSEHDLDTLAETSVLPKNPTWTPFCLSRGFLLGNAVLFTLVVVALEVLHFMSNKDQGLATVSQDTHYLWTYGPLSFLTIIAAFWGQTEYRARQLTPWYLMDRGQLEHCLLLNYLTTSTATSFFRSIKNCHSLVILGILGTLLLRILIVLSTSLLSLEYRTITHQKENFTTEILDLGSLRSKVQQQTYNAPNVTGGTQFWAISHYNLSRPYEIISGSVVQPFSPSDHVLYVFVVADVPVFESKLTNCQTFNIPYDSSQLHYQDRILEDIIPEEYVEMLRPWCLDDFRSIPEGYTPPDSSLPVQYRTSLTDTVLCIHRCSNSTSVSEEDKRLLITMDSRAENLGSEISGIWCEPTYSLTRRTVTKISDTSGNGYQIHVSPEVKEDLELGATPTEITSYILRFFGVNGRSLDAIEGNSWYILLNQSEPRRDFSSFRNTTLVEDASKRLWAQFSAFAVEKGRKSLSNADQDLIGTAISSEGRLIIQALPLRLMETILVLLILSSITFGLLAPPKMHRDPGSVGAHALVMARSPSLGRWLAGRGASRDKALQIPLENSQALLNPRVEEQNQPDYTISVTSQSNSSEPGNIEADKSRSNWWNPAGETWWFRLCIFAAAIILTATIQILFHASQKNEGLANVDTDGYQKYTWTYIPTMVMASLGIAYSVADSTARVLHPFQLLRKGNASLGDIMYDPASQVSFTAVIQAATNHHFALAAIILTGLLTPILTIATSGLYTPVPIPWSRNVSINARDWFSVGNMSTGMDSSSANQEKEDFSVFHLVEFANMSYPTWTHDQYAFATIKEEGLQGHNGNNTALGLNARIPALRGNLNCSLANYYTRQNLSEHSPGGRIITVQPPSGCRTPRENLTEGRLVWLSFVDEPEADYEVRYLQDVYPGKSFNYSSTEGRTTPGTVCGDNRQHFWYIAGSSTNGDWDDITLIHCVPYIEALLVNVSFFLPEFQIDTSAPIIPDEASATPFSNESSAGYIGSDFEHFSQALENGTHGTPFSELTGIANAAKFIERVDSLYRVWTAQSLHFYFRHPAALPLPANTTNDPAAAHFATDPFRAVLTDRTRLRLVQSEVSTRILQGVLLALALCVALAFVLEPRTRLLPRDPGSVAAKMSLFADGRVWRSVPEGAETWGDGEMESRGLLRDVLFRMGWWGGEMEEGGGRRWFGVDGEEERDG